MLTAGTLGKHRFNLARCGHSQHKVVGLVSRGRPGDVNHAEDLLCTRKEHRCSGASPAFDALAKMLCSVYLNRPPHRQRCADSVGSDDTLVPMTPFDQVDGLPRFARAHVAGNFQYHAILVGQHHD